MNNKEPKRKTFVLDTNVLIHTPQALFEFEDNRVVLPMKVIEELDKFKSYKDEKGLSVRTVTRKLDELRQQGNIKRGIILENGGIIQIVTNYLPDYQPANDLDEDYYDEFEIIDTSIPDNEIILTALKLQREHKEKVIFVSKDLNTRIKAAALGIRAQDYEKQKVVVDDLYTGYTKLLLSKDKIDSFYQNDKLHINELSDEIRAELIPNIFLNIVDKSNPQHHTGIGRYIPSKKSIVPIKDLKRPVWGIHPLNREQKFVFDALLDDSITLVTMIGQAGTGKTLLAVAAGLLKTVDEKVYSKLVISRPIVPMGKDLGYLPGSKDEKLHYWMQPIFDNLRYILNEHGIKGTKSGHSGKDKDDDNDEKPNPDIEGQISYLRDRNYLELEALTYIRGRSLPKQYLIVDEAQNLTPHEVKTIISRAGESTKVVLTGDPYQIDNPYLDSNSNGLIYTIDKFKKEDIHAHIRLVKSERSKLASLAAQLL